MAGLCQQAHAQAVLSISVTSNGPWTVGQIGAAYTLTVLNTGTITNNTILVHDALPRGIGIRPASGFAPAPGWACTYSDEDHQRSSFVYPNTGMPIRCISDTAVPPGGTVVLTLPVLVTSAAFDEVTNDVSVGGGGDPVGSAPDAGPSCTDATHCAQATTAVAALPPAPASCTAGTPLNLLGPERFEGEFVPDHLSETRGAALIATAGNYRLGTGPGGRFVVNMRWRWSAGIPEPSGASSLTLHVNGTSYATLTTRPGFTGDASMTASNGASLFGGTSTMELNRMSVENVWVTLPASATTITKVEVTYVSGEAADDFFYSATAVLACPAPLDLSVTKTNTPAQGPVDLAGDVYVPGEARTYSIVVTNSSGTYAARPIRVSDPTPAGIAAGAVSWQCASVTGGATCGAFSGSGALDDPGLNLPPGASATYTVSMTVPTGFTGVLANTATIIPPASVHDPNPANNTSTDADSQSPRVTIRKVSLGGTGTFAFTGSNGVAAQTLTTSVAGTAVSGMPQVLVAAGIATTVTEVAPPAGYVLTGISCTGLPGGTATVDLTTLTVTLSAAATVAGANIDCTFSNTAAPGADLSIVKASSVASARAGDVVSYTLTGANNGPAAANGAVIRDLPGAGLDCITPGPTATCTATGGAACPGGAVPVASLQSPAGVTIPILPAGGGIVITLQCLVTATGLP